MFVFLLNVKVVFRAHLIVDNAHFIYVFYAQKAITQGVGYGFLG